MNWHESPVLQRGPNQRTVSLEIPGFALLVACVSYARMMTTPPSGTRHPAFYVGCRPLYSRGGPVSDARGPRAGR